MKAVLTALLLFTQLQPLVGSAVCLNFAPKSAERQCDMPDHMTPPSSGVAQAETPPPNCPLAAICAPSQLAIAGLAEPLHSIMDLRVEAAIVSATPLFSISFAPPFHPPRA